MKIAVVIPTLGRSFFALNMVMLLLDGTRVPDEILVVDQTEPEMRNPFAYKAIISYQSQGLCRIIEHPIKSLTVARNIGIRNTDADLLIFVDDDAFIPPNFVDEYQKLFAEENLDAATGMILINEADRGTIDTSKVQASKHDGHTMLRGGNFAVRRKVIELIGGLDENFVGAANHEDADLAFRLHQHGCKVIWAPGPWLFHLAYRGGGGRIKNPHANINFAYNLCYFHLRHKRLNLSTLFRMLRWRVFNKQGITRPWKLAGNIKDFIVGYRRALDAAAAGPNLPFNHKQKES